MAPRIPSPKPAIVPFSLMVAEINGSNNFEKHRDIFLLAGDLRAELDVFWQKNTNNYQEDRKKNS